MQTLNAPMIKISKKLKWRNSFVVKQQTLEDEGLYIPKALKKCDMNLTHIHYIPLCKKLYVKFRKALKTLWLSWENGLSVEIIYPYVRHSNS